MRRRRLWCFTIRYAAIATLVLSSGLARLLASNSAHTNEMILIRDRQIDLYGRHSLSVEILCLIRLAIDYILLHA